MNIDTDQIYEIYEFIKDYARDDKLEIAIHFGNNTKTFCKFLRDYILQKDIIKKYFRIVVDYDDIETFKELADTLISTQYCIRCLRLVGNQTRINAISEKLEFTKYLGEIQIYDIPFDTQINQQFIQSLYNIPEVRIHNFDLVIHSFFLATATIIHDNMIRNEINTTISFLLGLGICKRLKLLILCNLHASQFLKNPMLIDLLVSDLPKNITIEFRDKSLLDPCIICIIKLLAEKRKDLKIEINIYKVHSENLCGCLANKHLKDIKNYCIDGFKYILFNYDLTYKELLKQLREADLYLYMMWSQIRYP
jgi:hypothetical protein